MGMNSPLLGRAERSTPEARRGHAVWRAGVDGESASRAIIVVAHDEASCEGLRRPGLIETESQTQRGDPNGASAHVLMEMEGGLERPIVGIVERCVDLKGS